MENVEGAKLFEGGKRVDVVQKETVRRSLKWIDLLPQLLASSLMYIVVIQAGINMSFASVLITQLSDSNEIEMNKSRASIIGSIWSIAVPFGALSSGFLCDKMGRKKIGLIICFPFIFAWLLIVFAKSIEMIFIARIIAGICCGLSTTAVIYTAEISYKTFRSTLLCMNSAWVSLGIFLTYLLNYFHLNWHLIGWIYAAMSLLSLLLILIVPESSHWILFFNSNATDEEKRAQLRKCLSWLYRNPEHAASQYNELLESYQKKIDEQMNQTEQNFSWKQSIKEVYKPLIILIVIFFLQQFSGGYVLIFYALNIFRNLGSGFASSVDEKFASLLLGSIRLVMSIVAAVLSQKCNRKTLLRISTFGMSAFAFISSGKMWSIDGGGNSIFLKHSMNQTVAAATEENLIGNYLLLICILSYIFFASLALLVIPWTLAAELFPMKYKAKYSGLTTAIAYLLMALVLGIFPFMLDAMSISVIFLIFGTSSLLCGIFIHFYLPETHRRTFAEIEKHFTRK